MTTIQTISDINEAYGVREEQATILTSSILLPRNTKREKVGLGHRTDVNKQCQKFTPQKIIHHLKNTSFSKKVFSAQ